MRIGAHVSDGDPIKAATERNAAAVQFFLADPQAWTAPRAHPRKDHSECTVSAQRNHDLLKVLVTVTAGLYGRYSHDTTGY